MLYIEMLWKTRWCRMNCVHVVKRVGAVIIFRRKQYNFFDV